MLNMFASVSLCLLKTARGILLTLSLLHGVVGSLFDIQVQKCNKADVGNDVFMASSCHALCYLPDCLCVCVCVWCAQVDNDGVGGMMMRRRRKHVRGVGGGDAEGENQLLSR